MLDVRKEHGPHRLAHALCEELDLRLVNKRVFESLVKAGAFDSLLPTGGRAAVAARGRGCSPRSTRASSTAAGTSAIATRARSQLFGGGGTTATSRGAIAAARGAAVDRDRSSSPSRRKRSAST